MTTRILDAFADISADYDALVCDVWGVLHDGVTVHPAASDALRRFRDGGGRVLLVSNAPRPGHMVKAQLTKMGVAPDAYDDVLTSGDIAWAWLNERPGLKIATISAPMHDGLFDKLDLKRVEPTEADWVVCTALEEDDTETPEDYEDRLKALHANGVRFLCANPDYVVERGGRLVYCPGALADRYRELGGEVLDTGKPSPLIYDEAFRRLAALLGREPAPACTLAIGDALRTDMTGARTAGIAGLWITKGIHADEVMDGEAIDEAKLTARMNEAGLAPRYAQAMLR